MGGVNEGKMVLYINSLDKINLGGRIRELLTAVVIFVRVLFLLFLSGAICGHD